MIPSEDTIPDSFRRYWEANEIAIAELAEEQEMVNRHCARPLTALPFAAQVQIARSDRLSRPHQARSVRDLGPVGFQQQIPELRREGDPKTSLYGLQLLQRRRRVECRLRIKALN